VAQTPWAAAARPQTIRALAVVELLCAAGLAAGAAGVVGQGAVAASAGGCAVNQLASAAANLRCGAGGAAVADAALLGLSAAVVAGAMRAR
jgi:hypothetical protein